LAGLGFRASTFRFVILSRIREVSWRVWWLPGQLR